MYIQSYKYNLENRPTKDFKLIIHADVKPPNEYRGRYNASIVDEVAVIFINEVKGRLTRFSFKTFITNLILAKIRSQGKLALVVCSIPKNGALGKILQNATFMIWDQNARGFR